MLFIISKIHRRPLSIHNENKKVEIKLNEIYSAHSFCGFCVEYSFAMSTPPEAKQQNNDNARAEDLEDWSLTFPSDLPESVAFEIPLEKKVSFLFSIINKTLPTSRVISPLFYVFIRYCDVGNQCNSLVDSDETCRTGR